MSPAFISLFSLGLNIVLGGGLLAVLLRHREKMRDVERVDFSTVLAEVKGQRDEAWTHINKQDERMALMEAEIQGLRLARDLDPFPNWVVDLQGKHIFVNREFERVFLEPRGETYRWAIGKTHEEMGWPADFCRTLLALDTAARSRPDGTARAVTAVTVEGLGAVAITVHKFPIRFKPAGIIVAYAGFITDIIPQAETLARRST